MNINIIAVNIKTGGGKTLLFYFIGYLLETHHQATFHLDKTLVSEINKTFKNRQGVHFKYYGTLISKAIPFLSPIKNGLYFGNFPPMSICKNQSIVFFQNYFLLKKTKSPKLKLQQIYMSVFLKKCNKVIVQTNHVKEEIFNKFKLEAIKTPIYETISPKKTNKIYDFIYPASNSSNKNHKMLFESLSKLDKKLNKKITVVLTLPDLIKKRVIFNNIEIINVGELDHKDIILLMSKTRFLVFPSIFESFGLPLIEAAQLGLKVIAPKTDYVTELIKPSLFFNINSPNDLKNKMYFALNNETPSTKIKIESKISNMLKELKI